MPDCAAFIREYNGPLLDLTGKTDLVQMLTVLKNAACLISVDTGSVHLAAAVQCPVFAIFNGRHYGRFAPYPKEIASRLYPVYPDEIDELLKKNIPFDTDTVAMDLVKKVPPEKLIAVIDRYYPVAVEA
jgi:ADP-heptose:LPS heptosyltransferase